MDDFVEDLQSGRIQFRDKWQFELKSDLFHFSHLGSNVHSQEFYFFVPNSLQINDQTYTKAQFYLDQTNMIRLKTPVFSFKELTDEDNTESPLVRILMICDYLHNPENREQVEEEIKLLGSIFHSTLRNKIVDSMAELDRLNDPQGKETFAATIHHFCQELVHFRSEFMRVKEIALNSWLSGILNTQFDYLDEFISLNINDYLSILLHRIRLKNCPELHEIDKEICEQLIKEMKYRQKHFREPSFSPRDHHNDEYILYRKGLLNKFVIDPLLLKTSRSSIERRFRGLLLGLPAAIAMSIFMLLYVWQGKVFLVNSEPFILLTIFIYILKDRLKEELRLVSYRQAAKWFSDYTTEIKSPTDDSGLGSVNESFSFVNESEVPHEIIEIRNREFHTMLETFKRPEQIIYYKKTVKIKKKPKKLAERFYGFSIIFRFDVHHFLTKTENPFQATLLLDPATQKLNRIQLPRVYHLNIIIKNIFQMPDGDTRTELMKYRLIVDKNGIKRIESF